MFIPPNKLKDNFQPTLDHSNKVALKSSHLLIGHEIVAQLFGQSANVYVVYYADRKTLLIAPTNEAYFKNLHNNAAQQMLKNRNLKGDKSIAIHETLIDNQVDTTDRDLLFELEPKLNILSVKL